MRVRLVASLMTLWVAQFALLSETNADDGCLPADVSIAPEAVAPVGVPDDGIAADTTAPSDLTSDLASEEASFLGVENSIHIYYDVSGSMVGYIDPPKNDAYPPVYADLTLALPDVASAITPDVFFYEFGERIVPLPAAELNRLITPSTYSCALGRAGCQESRINETFELAASDVPSSLHVIVTDLFLAQGDLIGTPGRALQAPLWRALEQGKAIALVGVAAGFNGRIFDLPSGGSYDHADGRPLYLVIVGPLERIATFLSGLDALLGWDATGVEVHQTIYSHPVVVRRFTSGHDFDIEAMETAVVPRTASSMSLQEVSADRDALGFVARFDPSSLLSTGSFSLAGIELKQDVWIQARTSGDCEARWQRLDPAPKVAEIVVEDDGRIAVVFFRSQEEKMGLPSGYSYLLRSTVTALDIKPLDANWTESWSFVSADEAEVLASQPSFFPTLNLQRIASMLTNLVEQNYEQQEIAELLIFLRLED